ncbi:hypothetical protein OLMES_2326 [Oleiphilus messinensis]|uniref:Uncharacterized protein n=1 Tax=Oleiphilus messinensis TaxID=141451 RepID=A0A1Y0I867_9GAMM|nr:hypothetical protein [Oleiphilus messinensis]ARU56389.1 hypothetical protein OLMES_2326 [Oleiphilus messinensis]
MAQYIDNYNIFKKIDLAYRTADDALDRWIKKITIPYSDAYDIAYKNYTKTLKEAEEIEKQRAELAFLALSLCSGSLLASALALSMRSTITSYALKVICNNMNRTFEIVHYADVVKQNCTTQLSYFS